MPDPIPLVPQQTRASPVQTTSLAAAGTGGALIVAQWLVAPEWPPSLPVLTVIVTAMTPVVHMLGRAVSKRLAIVADKIDGPDDTPTATAEVTLSAEMKP